MVKYLTQTLGLGGLVAYGRKVISEIRKKASEQGASNSMCRKKKEGITEFTAL